MMHFEDESLGFSFELPDGWRQDKENVMLTFFGPNGRIGCTSQLIQMQIGTILPQYLDPLSREAFLAEPGAHVFRTKVGGESNVVVLKKPSSSEISIVRDGVQYSICHSNDAETETAIERLSKSTRFPSRERAEAFVRSLEHPRSAATPSQRVGLAEVLTPKELREAQLQWAGRHIFIEFERDVDGPQTAARLLTQAFQAAGAIVQQAEPGADAIIRIGACLDGLRFWFSVHSPQDPCTPARCECAPQALTAAIMAAVSKLFDPKLENRPAGESSSEHTALVAALDDADQAKRNAAKRRLLRLGNVVVQDLLRSVTKLNRQIMALDLTDEYELQCEYVDALAQRIALLGELHAEEGLDAVVAALADGANSAAHGSPASQRLADVAGDALVALGEPARTRVAALLGRTCGPVRAALQAAYARFEREPPPSGPPLES